MRAASSPPPTIGTLFSSNRMSFQVVPVGWSLQAADWPRRGLRINGGLLSKGPRLLDDTSLVRPTLSSRPQFPSLPPSVFRTVRYDLHYHFLQARTAVKETSSSSSSQFGTCALLQSRAPPTSIVCRNFLFLTQDRLRFLDFVVVLIKQRAQVRTQFLIGRCAVRRLHGYGNAGF